MPQSYIVTTLFFGISACGGTGVPDAARDLFFSDSLKGDWAPVISILGENPTTLSVFSNYQDAGATALSVVDGDVSSQIVLSNLVDVNVVGDYLVTYRVNDSTGRETRLSRSVRVRDLTAPVLTLVGNPNVSIEINSSPNYIDAGVNVTDNYDGLIASRLVVENNVDIHQAGDYTVTYRVTDFAGNPSIPVVRNVHVVVSSNPIISAPSVSLDLCSRDDAYLLDGVTAVDSAGLPMNPSMIHVDTDLVVRLHAGDYQVTYFTDPDSYGHIGFGSRQVHVSRHLDGEDYQRGFDVVDSAVSEIGTNLNLKYLLCSDIALGNLDKIGSSSNPFTGTLNGNGHKIHDGRISGTPPLGFFASVSGSVKNIRFENIVMNVTGSGDNIGTVAGRNSGSLSRVSVVGSGDCFVQENNHVQVGGLVGLNSGGAISESFASVGVCGSNRVGGLVGYAGNSSSAGTVNASFWDADVSGSTSSNQSSSQYGQGLSTRQMQSPTPNAFSIAGWNFSTIWIMPDNDYPRLR